jgi:2-polyprenyl-3-methyl-5-hydroxy-6-metoxy-1,4-benzoquinol methylase
MNNLVPRRSGVPIPQLFEARRSVNSQSNISEESDDGMASTMTASLNARREVACHICSSHSNTTYIEARGYRIAQCKNCGLWFVNPQPTVEELRQFYATYDDGDQWRNLEERFNRGVRDAILQVKRSGSVLDVGCGSGNFLRCMKEKGFTAFGIEPSGSGSEYARDEHGVQIFHGMIEDYLASHRDRKFDVITMLNVLEHVTDPVGILSKLSAVLASDGVLAIVVPDARFHDWVGRIRRFAGISDPFWIEQPKSFLSGFKLPDHLCSFQPATIAALLERSKFQVTTMRAAPVVINPGINRSFAKLMVYWVSKALHVATFRRVLVGYSTMVLATKRSA